MAQSDIEVANIALLKLGEDPIAALAGTDKVSVACNTLIEPSKKAVLRLHPWNFALKRYVYDLDDVVGTANNGGEVKVTTDNAHGLATGDKVTITEVVGTTEANGTWTITKDDATNFTLDDSTYANAWTSGGEYAQAAPYEFTYMHSLPTGCLRLLEVDQDDVDPVFRVEGGKLLTYIKEPEILYVYDVTDYTLMDPMFYEALSTYLAWNLCFRLPSDIKQKDQLWNDFKSILSKARFVDGTEDSIRRIEANEWLASRLGTTPGYITNT